MKADKKKIEELLTRGVAEVIGRDDLERALLTGKLRVKLGIDPTSPNLHIGRGVVLLKLRDFQELGHLVVFIVGDFTGEIGDTSDKDTERPKLSTDQVKQNMNTYLDQAGKILDMNKVEVHYNSEWLENPGYREILRQADVFSLAPFINRENIKKRLDEGGRISLRGLLPPDAGGMTVLWSRPMSSSGVLISGSIFSPVETCKKTTARNHSLLS